MIDFSTLQGLTIPEGVVTQIADASGRVLWKQAPSEATVTITGNGYSSATATINGVTYNTATTLVVPIGTVITCFANYEYRNYIWVNGEDAEGTVDDYGYSLEEDLYYDYTVTGNVLIHLSMSMGDGYVKITEIPEGSALVNITSDKKSEENFGRVTINGTTYKNNKLGTLATLVVPVGTEALCVGISGDYSTDGGVYVNGVQVASGGYGTYGVEAKHTHIITGDTTIQMVGLDDYGYYGTEIYITEQ